MNSRLRRCLPPLAVGALLLGLSVLFGRTGLELRDAEERQRADTGLLPKERSARPVRASLSMPYFSFGQSLRPRG